MRQQHCVAASSSHVADERRTTTHRSDRDVASHLKHLILLASLEPIPDLTDELMRHADGRLSPVERRRTDEVVVGNASDAGVLPFFAALEAGEWLREEGAGFVSEWRGCTAREVAAV